MTSPAAVPLIYSPRAKRVRIGAFGRVVALLIGLTALTPLAIAAFLTPSPDGLGTHEQLGLPECAWYHNLGFPCPTCGMTTSWAYFARGDFPASVIVQPMGTILAFGAVMVFWGGVYIAATGRAAHHLLLRLPTGYIAAWLLVLWLLAWGWKIFIHWHPIGGWQ